MHRPFTRHPYPAWYRNLPIVLYMPWRNLGCLGIKLFRFYGDLHIHPHLGVFWTWKGEKRWYQFRWLDSIRNHVASNLANVYWEQRAPMSRWQTLREYARVTSMHIRYDIGRWYCDRYGHSRKTVHEDFVATTRDEHGRITDIDGGGISWFCPRCGRGGQTWW